MTHTTTTTLLLIACAALCAILAVTSSAMARGVSARPSPAAEREIYMRAKQLGISLGGAATTCNDSISLDNAYFEYAYMQPDKTQVFVADRAHEGSTGALLNFINLAPGEELPSAFCGSNADGSFAYVISHYPYHMLNDLRGCKHLRYLYSPHPMHVTAVCAWE